MTSHRILQHNVLQWNIQRFELANTYAAHQTAIIFINSHGQKVQDRMKIFQYNIYQRNASGERADGVAVAIKKGLKLKILDDFEEEFLDVEIETIRGPRIIATGYLPPRRPYLPYPDFLRLIRLQKPVYIMANLNARHRTLCNSTNDNVVGNSLAHLMSDGRLVLANRYAHLNTRLTPGTRRHHHKSPPSSHFGYLHKPSDHTCYPNTLLQECILGNF